MRCGLGISWSRGYTAPPFSPVGDRCLGLVASPPAAAGPMFHIGFHQFKSDRRIRMFARVIGFIVVLGFCASSYVHADEQAADGPWFGNVKLGYLATSGNTENSNLNTSFQLGYGKGQWVHTLDAFAINASESNVTTAEAYELGWKSELKLSESDFLFGRLNWRKDRFSGYPKQFSQSLGYGRRLIDTGPHSLNAEIGGGARQAERADGVTENDFIVRGGLDYRWQFSETAAFSQGLVIESGKNNTYLESISAVKARLIGNLALVASYTAKNNSDVLPGTEKTDTYSALSLEYQF
jgi:putative salt-induced outer membrane protein